MSFSRLLKAIGHSESDHGQANSEGPSHSRGNSDSQESQGVETPVTAALGIPRSPSEPSPRTKRIWKKKSGTHRSASSPSLSSHSQSVSTSAASPTRAGTSPIESSSRAMLVPVTSSINPTNVLLMLPPTMPLPSVDKIDALPDSFATTWDQLMAGPKNAEKDKTLNTVDDAIASLEANVAPFQPLIGTAVSAIEQSKVGKVVKDGVDHFFEGMPVLMNALDEVADLHPFIGVVVMAFKTVYTLELKRRDNESKVIALYVEMKDMMAALLQLKDVRDREVVGPSYQKVEDRMKTLIERTAEDIKRCSNTCDTYAKKKLLAKVFQGPFWDQKLLSFVELFTKRRAEFEFALSVHTSLGVEQANAKLDIVDVTTKALNDKMDNMLVVFQQMMNPEQKRLGELVRAKGGVRAVKESDILLAELDLAAHKISEHGAHDEDRHQHQTPVTPAAFDALKTDVFEAPDAAVEKNMVVFSRKFEVQKRQIIDELTLVVKREGDRVIEKVTSGPHERIVDQSIHEIWKEMGWRGNVKALHFVLALRDHYIDKLRSEAGSVRGVSTVVASRDPDAWAIAFIDVLNLQPILEAFDDDASGFITITEMNRFTSSRPLDWSLPHWVSFWAIGWKTSVIWYARRLEELFAKIDGIAGQVLTPNREFVAHYQNVTWRGLHSLTAAVKGQEYGPSWDKFSAYVEAEEKRLETNLKAVDYVIDASDTLTLITGEGRLEKTLFPLLFLLVKRHFDVMRVACKKVVSERELLDGESSIQCVMGAVFSRVRHLESIFLQQRLEPEKHFKTFAIGIYRFSYHKSNDLWTLDYMQNLETPVVPYDAAQDENLDPQDVLKYKFQDELTLDDWVYDADFGAERHQNDTESSALPLNRLLGQWHGYYYTANGEPERAGWDAIMSMVIERATDEKELQGNGYSNIRRFTISGSWSEEVDATLNITYKMSYLSTRDFKLILFFNLRYDPAKEALIGVWGSSSDSGDAQGQVLFRRMLPRHLLHYPSLAQLEKAKARSLWTFAINAVMHNNRRERWAWSYFAQRRDTRQTFKSLAGRSVYLWGPTSSEENGTLIETARRLLPEDACFYASQLHYMRATSCLHGGFGCDGCGTTITSVRIVCVDCLSTDYVGRTLDLCDTHACTKARVTSRSDLTPPHEPTHHVLKVRTSWPIRQYGPVYAIAKKAVEKTESVCSVLATSKIAATTGRHATATETPIITPFNEAPSCRVCKGALSPPFWYCLYCEDDLYICNACDAKGVPELPQHTANHHLLRCQEPLEESRTEQRAVASESRLDTIEAQLNTRFGELSNRIDALSSMPTSVDELSKRLDVMSTRMDAISSRVDDVLLLLRRLADAQTPP